MFATIREKVSLLQVIEEYENQSFKQVGEATYALEDETCPFCGHRDCFRIKSESDSEAFFKCFSCDVTGDVINYVALKENLEPWPAVKHLSKKYSIPLPADFSPVQEVLNLAALYYHNLLVEGEETFPELMDVTPMQYQMQTRKHTAEGLEKFQVGWSDGNLIDYLSSVGFEQEILEQSGLMNKRGKDFFPAKVFIYPHVVKGRVSHFTQKDPLKKCDWQFRNKNSLNGYMVYNQDSIFNHNRVIIVEGENDLISVWESGWKEGLIGTIGQLSAKQIEWMTEALKGKEVLTIFDPDDAGDKYRSKVGKISSNFEGLSQIRLAEQDIDEYLRAGNTLASALEQKVNQNTSIAVEGGGEITISELKATPNNICEKDNCYYKVTYKDGEPIPVRLSNFVIKLRNIFISGQSREREVVFIRHDGRRSSPIVVSSENKVSLKSFKTLAANSIDAAFYGQEADLASVWDYIYATDKEREVLLPSCVGSVPDILEGWLFRNCFITSTGQIIKPDREGVIWLDNHTSGVKAADLMVDSGGGDKSSIPSIECDMSDDEAEALEANWIQHLAVNLGSVGDALIIAAWAKANVYSNQIFRKNGSFPFLFFWGRNGKGKTIIAKWVLGLFGMDEVGWSTMPQFKSGVGFSRKIAYYGSLPVCLDEIRADNETTSHYGIFRAWWNRSGRDLGVRDSGGIKHQRVVSNVLFVGQDQFSDPATRQRCIPIRISKDGRELVESYRYLESIKEDSTAITFHWILESTKVVWPNLESEIVNYDKALRDFGVEQRNAKNWSAILPFAKQLADKHFAGRDDLDIEKYIFDAVKQDCDEQETDDTVLQFLDHVEQLQVGERPLITDEHIKVEGGFLYIWFSAIYKIVADSSSRSYAGEQFSKAAIKRAMAEEEWFVEDTRKGLGIDRIERRVIKINLDNAPVVLQNIAGRD